VHVIHARNVQQALPKAIGYMELNAAERDSRNGPVLIAPGPVTTVYTHPNERVLFWAMRDANPFFHLYESLWMLAGRNDLKPLLKYAKQMAAYSDDGTTLHGAYGHRWRSAWDPLDQLRIIARRLQKDPNDRRCVLQMWDAMCDLDHNGKDVPCNTTATFQRGPGGELHLVVFNRSNDIIWGCYGANAVHFSFLLEYMAHWIGCPVGTYSQVSVNWHAYKDVYEKYRSLPKVAFDAIYSTRGRVDDPYRDELVEHLPIDCKFIDATDAQINRILMHVDNDFSRPQRMGSSLWGDTLLTVLYAHHLYKRGGDDRFDTALEVLSRGYVFQKSDWVLAAREWIERRRVMATDIPMRIM
jgi:hypothetical protein